MKAIKCLMLIVPLMFTFSFLPAQGSAEEPAMEPKEEVKMAEPVKCEDIKDPVAMEECKKKLEEEKAAAEQPKAEEPK